MEISLYTCVGGLISALSDVLIQMKVAKMGNDCVRRSPVRHAPGSTLGHTTHTKVTVLIEGKVAQ
jgi:hypothetical protein